MSVEDLLPGYLAGELSEPERGQVDAALATSPRLRAELESYARLFTLLSAAAAETMDVPTNLEARIARQVAMRAYLNLASQLLDGLLGAYGRALVYYFRLAGKELAYD